MSYYDYYGGYGDDTAPADNYYEEAPVEMEEEESMKMTPVMMAFFLVPLADFFVYYKINDFNTASTSEWTNAGNVALAGGAIKLVGIAAHMAAGVKLPIPAISLVQEIAALYLINTADGTVTSGDVNMYYGAAAFGAVVSLANVVMMKDGDDEEMVEDEYYGEEVAEDTPAEDDYGYYGYY
jgi:hypothetical protein